MDGFEVDFHLCFCLYKPGVPSSLFSPNDKWKSILSISAGADFACNLAESIIFWFRGWWGFTKDRTKSVLEQVDVSDNVCCRCLGGACESPSKKKNTLCY